MTNYPIVTETRIIKGIRLPWQRIEPTGPIRDYSGAMAFTDRAPKGTVLESGEVFIPLSTLEELAEQDKWDSQFGSAFLLGAYEGLALEAAGLAEPETRGGYHRTEALLEFVENMYDAPVTDSTPEEA